VDVVARLHQRRTVDFRKARRPGHHDGLFVWRKGEQQSTILSPEEWAALPEEIEVRIVRFTAACRGFRSQHITLVTTLLDAQQYPAAERIALYARRWRLELCLRDVKTTLGLETLRCQSPAMVRKELLAGLIAHNLIRCVMAEAAQAEETQLGAIKFQGRGGRPAAVQRGAGASPDCQAQARSVAGSAIHIGARLGAPARQS